MNPKKVKNKNTFDEELKILIDRVNSENTALNKILTKIQSTKAKPSDIPEGKKINKSNQNQ